MQPLTRQEMQSAMQQLTNNITSQAATKQDLTRAIGTINQQSTAQIQNDLQRTFNQYADRILDRAYQEFKQQNMSMQQIHTKVDGVTRKSSEYDQRFARIESALIGIQRGIEELAQMHFDAENRQIAAREAQEEKRFAQRTAFGGLFS